MCQAIPSVKNKRAGSVIDWVKFISQVLLLPTIGLLAWAWWNHESRIDTLLLGQQSRFTAEDGVDVWKQIGAMQQILAVDVERLENHLLTSTPASNLVDRVTYTEQFLDHDRRIGRLEGMK